MSRRSVVDTIAFCPRAHWSIPLTGRLGWLPVATGLMLKGLLPSLSSVYIASSRGLQFLSKVDMAAADPKPTPFSTAEISDQITGAIGKDQFSLG